MNKFIPFSQKQLSVLNWWCKGSDVKDKNGIICDGAVRSGKTLCMGISFICWSFYAFSDTSFAICGKTISSLRRNVITPLLPTLKELGFSVDYRVSRNMITISRGNVTNRYYLFGGRDESSASLIQGMTLGGVMLDEVALMLNRQLQDVRLKIQNTFLTAIRNIRIIGFIWNGSRKQKKSRFCISISLWTIIPRYHKALRIGIKAFIPERFMKDLLRENGLLLKAWYILCFHPKGT